MRYAILMMKSFLYSFFPVIFSYMTCQNMKWKIWFIFFWQLPLSSPEMFFIHSFFISQPEINLFLLLLIISVCKWNTLSVVYKSVVFLLLLLSKWFIWLTLAWTKWKLIYFNPAIAIHHHFSTTTMIVMMKNENWNTYLLHTHHSQKSKLFFSMVL